MSAADDDDDWRYSLEDLEEAEGDAAESGGNVAGSFLPDEDLEPGDISLEHAVFVVLGVVVAGLVMLAFVLALT